MTKDQSPPEHIAAARQLYAVLKEYLNQPTWTPIDGTLIVSGIHPPPDCAEIPNGGVGLDGRIFLSAGNERFPTLAESAGSGFGAAKTIRKTAKSRRPNFDRTSS
ncbi:hypothetical protein [Paraburkholderia phenazinium]|uniref:hypothetical protein n=1 Tax=Paraburkholderia phenazinium TaxID=60549 RepID=UPI000B898883|nr:hypothetical protein [Paraburkholderia phenazinium]